MGKLECVLEYIIYMCNFWCEGFYYVVMNMANATFLRSSFECAALRSAAYSKGPHWSNGGTCGGAYGHPHHRIERMEAESVERRQGLESQGLGSAPSRLQSLAFNCATLLGILALLALLFLLTKSQRGFVEIHSTPRASLQSCVSSWQRAYSIAPLSKAQRTAHAKWDTHLAGGLWFGSIAWIQEEIWLNLNGFLSMMNKGVQR